MPFWAGFAAPLTREAGAGEPGTDLGHEHQCASGLTSRRVPSDAEAARTGGPSHLHGSSRPTSAPGAQESNLVRLLAFARVLQDVTSFGALLDATRAEVEAT